LVERHPNSARFHELLKQAGELHDKKQGDYGKGNDPFANVRSSSEWGISGWVGAMVRLNDKVKRLQKLAQKQGKLVNEPAKDSFMDIAVYALIAYVLFEEEEKSGETTKEETNGVIKGKATPEQLEELRQKHIDPKYRIGSHSFSHVAEPCS